MFPMYFGLFACVSLETTTQLLDAVHVQQLRPAKAIELVNSEKPNCERFSGTLAGVEKEAIYMIGKQKQVIVWKITLTDGKIVYWGRAHQFW